MTKQQANPLPSYERPPVIEVVCGIQFEPLPAFQAVAFGLLWQRFRHDYPHIEQKAPLGHVLERFSDEPADPQLIELANVPPLPRVFFVHAIPNWLLQVQVDRLLHNWRKMKAPDEYPRFPQVFDRFWSAWERFLTLCGEEELGQPKINQLEVTYINHILEDEGWDGLGGVSQVFPDLDWRNQRAFLPIPESLAWKVTFAMPEDVGRLHVSLRHALRREDERPVLLCELTARGMPKAQDADAIRAWFQLGREWIVRGFADLTSKQIQSEVWGRTT